MLAGRADLRVIVDRTWAARGVWPRVPGAGGAVLVTDADVEPDDPSAWSAARLGSRLRTSSAISTWPGGRAARQVECHRARPRWRRGRGRGRSDEPGRQRPVGLREGRPAIGRGGLASDAFFPFADAVEAAWRPA